MLKNIEFENYKAFKNGNIDLKPITILLGANSVGKSSIVQLLLMLTQTLNYGKQYNSAFRLNGEIVKLGENINIFHNQKPNNISLKFTLPSVYKDVNYKAVIFNQLLDITMTLSRLYQYLTDDKNDEMRFFRYNRINFDDPEFAQMTFNNLVNLKRKVNKALSEAEPELIEDINDKFILRNPRAFRHNRRFDSFLGASEDIVKFNIETNKIELDFAPFKHALLFLEKFDVLTNDDCKFSIEVGQKDNNLAIKKLSLHITETNVISCAFAFKRGTKHTYLKSDLLDERILKKYYSKFRRNIVFNTLSVQKGDNWESNCLLDLLFEIIQLPFNVLSYSFHPSNINYVSPLRAFPRRYYLLDDADVSNSLNTIDGNQLAEIIKSNPTIKTSVNEWLSKFGLKVNVSQLKDIIHNIRVNQGGLNLDITDVGFGISQVLPIIVQGFLSAKDSLTIIEQPEIHLHPKMQAELADLFIDMVKTSPNRSTIIETHSEYFLKRLRRRIAEGLINAEEIGLYFIERSENDKASTITPIEIEEKGAFIWPANFFIDDYEDTMAFLKEQVKQ